jgi:hypothetical protein
MKKIFLSAALLCCIFMSCTKSDNGGTTGCTLSSTSIIGEYKIKSIQFTPNGSPVSFDGLQYLPACDTDNVYALETNSVATITDAGVKCSPTPADATGSWSISHDTLSTTLSTTGQQTLSGKISGFSCTGGFTLSGTDTVSGIAGTAVIALVKQ